MSKVLNITDTISVEKNKYVSDFMKDPTLKNQFRKLYGDKTLFIEVFSVMSEGNEMYTGIVLSDKKLSKEFKDFESFEKLKYRNDYLVDMTEYAFKITIDQQKYSVILSEIEINFKEQYGNFKYLLMKDLSKNGIELTDDEFNKLIEKNPEIYLYYVLIKNLFSSSDRLADEMKRIYVYPYFKSLKK